MAIPNIKLDERTFQDLVDEAKSRIPRYTPEWTNHNVSDPGVTLIELFAYMVDQLLYQVNRVPEKNYRAFLNMIGVKMAPPNAARAEVTFRLSAPQPKLFIIPKNTEVATVRTENNPPRIFTTEEDLAIVPPVLKYIATSVNNAAFDNQSELILDPKFPRQLNAFQPEPAPGNTFYLGFDSDIAKSTLQLGLDCENLGVGINPLDPPLTWEYWDNRENAWASLEISSDTTEGLTVPFSQVELFIPRTAGQRELEAGGERLLAWWVRCRYTELNPNQPGYSVSPVIRKLSAIAMGGTVPVVQSQMVKMEDIGRSSGEATQQFTLQNTPILTLNREEETILVDLLDGTAPQVWKQVPDFAESGADDRHFTCDAVTGEIAFGPSLRSPDGREKQLGAIPPFGARIVMSAYRTGGGTEGNVGSGTINVLKTSLPYVSGVTNLRAASGGTSAESLEYALARGPRTLRARNRAVTTEDYEALTREATSGVARVRCLTPGPLDRQPLEERVEPGTVVLLVVPEVDPDLRELRTEHLQIPAGMRAEILDYLDERRMLTTQIDLTSPRYQWVTVQARIKTSNAYVNERVKREAERRLYRLIRPVQGGPDTTLKFEKPGEGWPWGRILYQSEIFPLLQLIEGVEYVERVEIYPVVDVVRGQAGSPVSLINPGARGLICSYRHQIILV